MMEYIATHSTGWWKEMAERALRDTEKAERMAREQGWQPGQCWALEVDAEAKQKLLDAEEANRVREEAERAKELAEKEAFVQRQMELLKKAGRAPRCEYQYTDGRGCKSPQVKGERWCHGHAKMMSYRPEKLEILPMEDEQAVMVNLYRVTKSLLAGRISEKVAGLTLWSIAIGARGSRVIARDRRHRRDRKDKPQTSETRRNGGSRGKEGRHSPQMTADGRRSERKLSRESTRKNTNDDALRAIQVLQSRQRRPLLQDDELKRADRAARGVVHPGVTNGKSFVSGVTEGSTPLGSPTSRVIADIAEIGKPKISPRRRGGAENGNVSPQRTQRNAE
jgi:hypothetical protein